jgi:hypothetical protein
MAAREALSGSEEPGFGFLRPDRFLSRTGTGQERGL